MGLQRLGLWEILAIGALGIFGLRVESLEFGALVGGFGLSGLAQGLGLGLGCVV